VAAPTTSLPEEPGGVRNWDYRYTWMRDAAFTLYALLTLGFTEEAGAFMGWLQGRFRYADRESGPLQIMYGIDGREDLSEEELPHLEGDEATFSMCSFWWVEALARAGRLDDARLAFEKMLTYANHVGLYSEEIGPTGEQLGNFPQALTHLALISAAYNLDRQLG
jgi:GH15 family glucan-1,4-alpha-glucosidase